MTFSLTTFACILIMLFLMVVKMTNPSWLAYSILRSLCILHGIEIHNVSRRTLYNWRRSGVDDSDIDLLALRLRVLGYLSPDAVSDIYGSCGYVPDLFSYASYVKCRAPGLS